MCFVSLSVCLSHSFYLFDCIITLMTLFSLLFELCVTVSLYYAVLCLLYNHVTMF